MTKCNSRDFARLVLFIYEEKNFKKANTNKLIRVMTEKSDLVNEIFLVNIGKATYY